MSRSVGHSVPSLQVKWIVWQVFCGLQCDIKYIQWTFQNLTILITVIHEIGIAHTDIKPDNILLRNDEFVKIIEMNVKAHFEEKVSRLKHLLS